jgi:hypothetical protein
MQLEGPLSADFRVNDPATAVVVLIEGDLEARVVSGSGPCPARGSADVGTWADFRGLQNSLKIEVTFFCSGLPKPAEKTIFRSSMKICPVSGRSMCPIESES